MTTRGKRGYGVCLGDSGSDWFGLQEFPRGRREVTMSDRGREGTHEGRTHRQGDGRADEGFGDDQGTRVGRPDPGRAQAAPSSATGVPNGEEGSILEGEPSRRGMTASDRANTGAGAEAAEGLHGSKGDRQPGDRSGVEHAHGEPGRGEGAGLSGSEPLRHRETEHKSGYGGEKADPKTSSDQR